MARFGRDKFQSYLLIISFYQLLYQYYRLKGMRHQNNHCKGQVLKH